VSAGNAASAREPDEVRGRIVRKPTNRRCDTFSSGSGESLEAVRSFLDFICHSQCAPGVPEVGGESALLQRCLVGDGGPHSLERAQTWQLLDDVIGNAPLQGLLTEAWRANSASLDTSSAGLETVDETAQSSLPSPSQKPVTERGLDPSQTRVAWGRSPGNDLPSDRRETAMANLGKWRQAWRMETLAHVVDFHEKKNDVQMCLQLAAVFASGGAPAANSDLEAHLVRWTRGAADVLGRMEAFVQRAELLRASPLHKVQVITQRNTSLPLRCAYCKAGFEPSRGLNAPRAAREQSERRNTLAPSSRSKGSKQIAFNPGPRRQAPCLCAACHKRRTPSCSICGEDVRGLWTACHLCGHGGHIRHVREWFASGERMCPAGCGCMCAPFG